MIIVEYKRTDKRPRSRAYLGLLYIFIPYYLQLNS